MTNDTATKKKSIAIMLAKTFHNELNGTRKILERIPHDKLAWKPHEKSAALGRLGMHIAELPHWIIDALEADVYDFVQRPFKARVPEQHAEIMTEFETEWNRAYGMLMNTSEDALQANWTLRYGEREIFTLPKASAVMRHTNHIVHHRGQLSVYLRMLDVPLPNLFGPTADER